MRTALAPILALGLAATGPAAAATVSAAPERVAVTIYRDRPIDTEDLRDAEPEEGLALVAETRTIDLPAGRSVVSFQGVADRIVPQTATLEGLKAAVLERNVDYDLLTPGALMARSVGRTVRLVRTDPATGTRREVEAIVRAAPYGVVLEIDGRSEALGCSNLPEKIVFDSVPPGLAERPTLSMVVEAKSAGPQTVKLSYLATGLAWSADYVASVSEDGRSLDLLGWITLANMSGTSFGQAPTEVVAGDLSRDEDTAPIEAEGEGLARTCWASPPPPPPPPPAPMAQAARLEVAADGLEEIVVTASMARQSDLGDYKLYSLPGATTVAARQVKQVAFLRQPKVSFERIYAYGMRTWQARGTTPEPQATIVLRVANKAAAGLGKPLPAGRVAVMERTAEGRMVLAGEHRLADDLPVGLTTDLEIGEAMDVSVRPRLTEERRLSNGRSRAEIEVEAVNAKPFPVVLEYRHMTDESGKVVGGARPGTTKGGDPVWVLKLAAGERRTFRYAVEEP